MSVSKLVSSNAPTPSPMTGETKPSDPDEMRRGTLVARQIKWGVAIIAAGAILLVGGIAAWLSLPATSLPADISPSKMSRSTRVLSPQAVSSSIDIAGIIRTARAEPIIAPFEGVVISANFELGMPVVEGEPLLQLGTTEILARYRDAQSAFLRAAIALQELEDWETGSEVQRARRLLDASEAALASLQRQVDDTQALFDRGIVARNELETLIEQRDAQRLLVDGASADLNSVIARGGSERRELLELDEENTRSRVVELDALMKQAVIKAPISGIVVRPPNPGTGWSPSNYQPGAKISTSEAIVSIAPTDRMTIVGNVDEIDVNDIAVGQSVTIESSSFGGSPIQGVVSAISSEAQPRDSASAPALFEVRAEFSIPVGADSSIKLGMSATMSVEIYENAAAIIVPPTSIRTSGEGTYLEILKDNGEVAIVPVVIGRSFPAGVEILSGAAAGTRIFDIPDMAIGGTTPTSGAPESPGTALKLSRP